MKYRFTLSRLTILLMTGFSSANVQAQSAFAGFYGQLSTGYEGNQLGSMTGTAVAVPADNSNLNRSSPSQNFGGIPLVLGIGYYWQASPNWLLGLGADYSALSQTSSTFSVTNTNAAGNSLLPAGTTDSGNGASLKASNRYNFFVSPAYVLDKEKIIYLKAGYSQVSAQYNPPGSATTTSANGISTTSATKASSQTSTLGGYLIGLGYKQMLASGFYGFVEGNYMGYANPSYSYTTGYSAVKNNLGVTSASTTYHSTNFNGLNTYQFLIGAGYAF